MKTENKIAKEISRRLVEVYHPEEILLFGSRAWGSPDNSSDFDLVVIIESSSETAAQRAISGHRALIGIPASVDLLVVTRMEFKKHLASGEKFWEEISNKGVKIYDAA